jgi:hypothetical protein
VEQLRESDLLRSTATICRQVLGRQAARRLMVSLAARATEPETPLPALSSGNRSYTRTPAQEEMLSIWSSMWRELAERCPAAFHIAPRRLHDQNPEALAFLYARRRGGSSAPTPLRLTDAEQVRVAAGRTHLLRWTGLAGLRRSARPFVIGRGFRPLAAYLESEDVTAVSFVGEPALRRHILICGRALQIYRQQKGGERPITALLWHEEVHAAVGGAVDAGGWFYGEPLISTVDEAATSLLELCATVMLDRGRLTLTALRRGVAGHPYRRQLACLLELLAAGDRPVAEIPVIAGDLVVRNLRWHSPTYTASVCNELSGRQRTAAEWLSCFEAV